MTPKQDEKARKYAELNPLGGPAKVFDAMASRIRAGEDYFSVLADYGFCVESAYNDLLRRALVLLEWSECGYASDDPEYQEATKFVRSRGSLLSNA